MFPAHAPSFFIPDVSTGPDVDGVPPAKEDQSESTQSDSDDCIIQAQTSGRKVGV